MLYTKRIEIKYSLIALALLAGLLALDRSHAFRGLDTVIDDFFGQMTGLGFVGFFVVAMIANATLLMHVPYTVPLLSLALGGASLGRILLMGTASGLGAALGEIVSYSIALKVIGENSTFESSSLIQWVKRMVNSHPRMVPPLLFVCAASPLPDDTVIIPLAMARYGIKHMVPPMLAGKIAHNLAFAILSYYFTRWSTDRVSTTIQVDLSLGILILFVMVILYQVEKTRALRPSFD